MTTTNSINIIFRWVIYIYILSLPFQSIGFKFIGIDIGLSEIIFLLLAPLGFIQIINSRQKFWIGKLDLFVLGWLISTIIAGWHAGFDSIVVTEIIKTLYLVTIYTIVKQTISYRIAYTFPKFIIFSSLIASLTSIIGFSMEYIGIDTLLTIKRVNPYLFENITQTKGFTPTPNMLASIIMIGILFHFQKLSMNKMKLKDINYFILVILLFGFFLTFSKTVVCLLIGIILVLYFQYKSILSNTWKVVTKITVACLFIVYIFATHFIIVKKDHDITLLKGDYISGPALIESTNFSIFPSQYWSLKRISLKAIHQAFPWGLGPGKFNDYAHKLKKNDEYPIHVPYPDPHSTYLGTLAENGLLGLITLSGIILFIIKYSRKILNSYSSDQYIFACFPSIFIAIGIDGISTDVMQFKHCWILLILLGSIFQNSKPISSK